MASYANKRPQQRLLAAIGMTVLCVMAPFSAALAQVPGAPAERASGPVAIKLETSVIVRADRTWQTITTQRVAAFTESAVERAGRQAVSYIDGMESLEVLAAYTEKPNGRRVAVDPTTFVRRDAAGASEVLYRDLKQITI